VIGADLGKLAPLRPGAPLRFEVVSLADAIEAPHTGSPFGASHRTRAVGPH